MIGALGVTRRALERVAQVMLAVAGWGFLVCAFFITFDVIARKYLGFNSKSTTELTGYFLALGIAWGLAGALAARAHVRIDMFIARLPVGPRAVLHGFALVLLAVVAGFLTFGAYGIWEESWAFNATDLSELKTPLWIPQGLWGFGIGFFALLAIVTALEVIALTIARRPGDADKLVRSRGYDEEAAEALEALGYDAADVMAPPEQAKPGGPARNR